MPIHEYLCLTCGDHYEALVRTGNSESEITCPNCGHGDKEVQFSQFATKLTAIHVSERPVILKNDKGEIRYPMNANDPIHPKFLAQGYRKEYAFETFAQRNEFERVTGKIHERSHYDTGSATAEKDLSNTPDEAGNLSKIKHRLNRLHTL